MTIADLTVHIVAVEQAVALAVHVIIHAVHVQLRTAGHEAAALAHVARGTGRQAQHLVAAQQLMAAAAQTNIVDARQTVNEICRTTTYHSISPFIS